MNQLRWDPTLREWVAYATHRQDRTFLPPAEYCPLDPTKPGGFPTEVPRESYDIVVFENKFPSFSPNAAEAGGVGDPQMTVAPGRGVCEVVLYSQDHDSTLAGMPEGRIRNLVHVWADRYEELGALDFVEYVFIFENKGEAIGVTLHHPHGQIYAYPFVPPRPKKELEAARDYRAENGGSCLHCDLLAGELDDGRRVVVEGEHFAAFVPYHAHFPYEAHVYARRCAPSIADLEAPERRDLARVLKRLLVGYDKLFGFSLPYMMVMHQAPTDGGDHAGVAHFHVEFYPPNRTADKLKYLAGSETGAGAYIVDALPEETAGKLREAVGAAR
ncbi:galactose-1-phosphate uridylyltransferase [Rubrobacter tropicus]|uniref:Galactose-1-phosphate uridylyltransferase n=1 Tax=Rubrobacter tropicus TaxID=2653851 RepID=A0A6G8QAE6_9ACTN|nr:galactose-1-phosphate uridylyltransferase [Rubrobacter tropicus]QIN83455.1 galactose-1-phosphate uridylyltransferase [Rubrobacter tropicus]